MVVLYLHVANSCLIGVYPLSVQLHLQSLSFFIALQLSPLFTLFNKVVCYLLYRVVLFCPLAFTLIYFPPTTNTVSVICIIFFSFNYFSFKYLPLAISVYFTCSVCSFTHFPVYSPSTTITISFIFFSPL